MSAYSAGLHFRASRPQTLVSEEVREKMKSTRCSRMLNGAKKVTMCVGAFLSMAAAAFVIGAALSRGATPPPSSCLPQQVRVRDFARSQRPSDQKLYRAIMAHDGSLIGPNECVDILNLESTQEYIQDPNNRAHIENPRTKVVLRGSTFEIGAKSQVSCDSPGDPLCEQPLDESDMTLCVPGTRRCFVQKAGEELSFETRAEVVLNYVLDHTSGLDEGDRKFLYDKLKGRMNSFRTQDNSQLKETIQKKLDAERRNLDLHRAQLKKGNVMGIPLHPNRFAALEKTEL